MDTHDLPLSGDLSGALLETNWNIADDIFVKRTLIRKAGIKLEQHVHKYDHHTFLAVGSVEVHIDGKRFGVFDAPWEFTVKAGAKHEFKALVDDTMIYCIHNISRASEIEMEG